MKKTLLATAIAGAMVYGATSAQAATVYDQDGTQLIVNGRIALGVRGGGPEHDGADEIDNGPEFVNVYSRLGLSMSHDISSDLRAFGRVEWRFTGDERSTFGSEEVVNSDGELVDVNTGSGGFSEVRHSYIGLESASLGTVMAGNYDSFYNSHVMAPFDVYIDEGLNFTLNTATTATAGGSKQARGDSIGYITPNLGGFTAFLSAKHYSDRGALESADTDDEIVTQGGVKYETGPLRLALGYVDDDVIGGGNGEVMYGTTASYAINDSFSARVGYETRDENEADVGGYDTWGLGMTYAMGQWAFNADLYDVDPDHADSRTAWAAGAYYKLSSNFDVFAELYQGDQPDITVGSGGVDTADGDDMYWLTGARYHF